MADIVNLEQIRAKNAFKACERNCFGGNDGGEVVKKLPPMIRENGFLGALAYAISKKEKETRGYAGAFDAIAVHLQSVGKVRSSNSENLQRELLDCDSRKLRDVTAEAMLYLDYLRRFAKKGEKSENE